jgi:hypothetical protein
VPLVEVNTNDKVPSVLCAPAAFNVIGYLEFTAVFVTPFAPPEAATYPASIIIAGDPLIVPKMLYSVLL